MLLPVQILTDTECDEIISLIRTARLSEREKAYGLLFQRLERKSKNIINSRIKNQFKAKFAAFGYRDTTYNDYMLSIINDALLALEQGILRSEIDQIERYYFRTLSNIINNFLRKNYHLLQEDVGRVVPEWKEPGESEEESEDCFAYAFKNLDKKCQDLLTLFYFDDLPQQQIAKLVNMTHGSVRNAVGRCKEVFKVYYTKCIAHG